MARSGVNRAPTETMVASAARTAAPALIFGLRLSASVCIALYIAFWLQLDDAYWAAASAAAVSQPSLGASLRKGWFRMIGTLTGATFVVVWTAFFVQNRAAFLVGLALWGGACALVATLLSNFASYAAALAGFTAVIVASDELGTTGGAAGNAFMFAVTRATEICIGIACAGVILAATDFGAARRRLAAILATLTQQIINQFAATLTATCSEVLDTQAVRREFIRRVIALDPSIDQAIGESSQLRHNSYRLQQAVYGLFDALAGWRTVVSHLGHLSHDQPVPPEGREVLQGLPIELRREFDDPSRWSTDPVGLLCVCQKAVRALVDAPRATPSGQLLVDQTAKVLMGISQALRALALLVGDPLQGHPPVSRSRLHVADWYPPLVNAGRAFLAIATAELVWVVTGWPNGTTCVIWAAITVVVFGPRADQASAGVTQFLLGTGIAVVSSAIVKFALLPQLETFVGLSIALACYLIPVGALSTLSWRPAVFTSMGVNFVALLTSENLSSYDTQQFYNSALALFAGSAIGAIAFRVIPPLPPDVRTARLLALTLRDLRRLACRPTSHEAGDWERRVYARLSVLPESATPFQRAQIVAALAAGTEIMRLHCIAARLRLGGRLHPALDALARGRTPVATDELARFDLVLAGTSWAEPAKRLVSHARGEIVALSEVLTQYAPYFDAGTPE